MVDLPYTTNTKISPYASPKSGVKIIKFKMAAKKYKKKNFR